MFSDYKILKKCSTTNARRSDFELANNTLRLPIFMPVATYGAMRALPTDTLEEQMILSNTYHLRNLGRNVKDFMGWKGSMLTDSGGFQIQSLPDVKVVDDGVFFDGRLFTPEDSMDAQMCLGADIMMQLDDVVNPLMPRDRHALAVTRSIEWLDRAITHINEANRPEDLVENKPKKAKVDSTPIISCHKNQIIFPIIQGGLDDALRLESMAAILKRKPRGLAIGGLCGGEDKNDFCRTVKHCCENLPDEMPRYVMGVGYPEDIVVSAALGADMFDCVYPTRTARFGRAFRDEGDLIISNALISDIKPIDEECKCKTCITHSRAYLATIKGTPVFCTLMSTHNLFYMRSLTERIRNAIEADTLPEFIVAYMKKRYFKGIPEWINKAMSSVGVIFK